MDAEDLYDFEWFNVIISSLVINSLLVMLVFLET